MGNVNSYFEANRATMARFLPAQYENVLEVGCASGGFAEHLGLARDLWGIEPNAEAASRARSKFNHVVHGTYDQVSDQIPDRYFDLVICNDVIEHMPDHEKFLLDIRKKLRPDALLIGSLPNIRHITSLAKLLVFKDWRYSDSGILDRTHLRFFTEKSIRRLFVEQKLELQVFEGLGSVIWHGLSRRSNPLSRWKSLLFRAGTAAVVVVSLGFNSDTQYPQFGFRVKFPHY